MAKAKVLFECNLCGFKTSKWLGKCPSCQAWDSFIEQKIPSSKKESSFNDLKQEPQKITNLKQDEISYFSTKEEELDLVLGGGVVQGGLYLIGGSPGVGKSTLLLKVASNLAKSGKKVLYVSAEESSSQIYLRAKRCDALDENLYLLNALELGSIKKFLLEDGFNICIIDSIQTIYNEELSQAPGSISQVRDVTFELMRIAKSFLISVFIIGHITKDGLIAGPRVLEHMVDCVLYFEGDKNNELKILRGFKNRFGSTSEIGIFEMKQDGLISAKDVSKKFFSAKKDMAGSAIGVVLEGSRSIVVEIQALVSQIEFGMPKRLASGYDTNRLNMLLALLEKKLGIGLNHFDVFINVAGGIKVNETSLDLALIASIISSFKNRALKASTAFIGEVSLIGDIREVGSLPLRLKELQNFGFKNVIIPKIPKDLKRMGLDDIKCIEVAEVTKIIDWM